MCIFLYDERLNQLAVYLVEASVTSVHSWRVDDVVYSHIVIGKMDYCAEVQSYQYFKQRRTEI